MSSPNYQEILDQIKSLACKTCYGSGELDDAEAGDIRFNTFPCKKCKGTGWKDGKQHTITRLKQDALPFMPELSAL